MLFKDIKQNYNLYILNTDDVSVKIGKVTSAGFPHIDSAPAVAGVMPNSRMVIDFSVEVDGKTASYVIPENATVTYSGNLVITPDKEIILHEVEVLKSQAEQAINAIDHQKQILERSTELLAELSPQFKEKRENEERFGKIEDSIGELKGMFGEFMKKFNSENSHKY